MTPIPIKSRLGSAPGYTLIEILTTLVVVSVGLLAIASLQLQGWHQQYSAQLRTVALYLGTEVMDRMRANPHGVALGAYDAISLPATTALAEPACLSPCTPQQMASLDVVYWQEQLSPPPGGAAKPLLPGGGLSIHKQAQYYAIDVQWQEKGLTRHLTLHLVP